MIGVIHFRTLKVLNSSYKFFFLKKIGMSVARLVTCTAHMMDSGTKDAIVSLQKVSLNGEYYKKRTLNWSFSEEYTLLSNSENW